MLHGKSNRRRCQNFFQILKLGFSREQLLHRSDPGDIPEKKQDLSAEIREKPVSTRYDSGEADPQLSMFPEESHFIDELRDLNLNEMTPLQALTYLHELTDRLKK